MQICYVKDTRFSDQDNRNDATHDLGARRRCVFVYTNTNRPCNRYYIANNKITWIDKPRYKRLSPILVAVDVKGKKSNVLPSYRRGWSVLARKKNYYTCHVNAVNNVSRPLHSNLICEYLSSILLIQLVEKVYEKYTISVRWVLSATITIFLSSATFSLLRTEKRNIRICITIFRFREKIEYGCYVGKKEDTRTLEWNDK